MSLRSIYRLSDNGYLKTKFSFASKQKCLENFLERFQTGQSIDIFVDLTNLQTSTKEMVYAVAQPMGKMCTIHLMHAGSSGHSWQHVKKFALTTFDDSDNVYFVEDDYLHNTDSLRVLCEGLEVADYVSLYDHKDKYIPADKGGNKFVDDSGGEFTRVFITASSHWKLTNSTTMTFATNIKTLKHDDPIWDKWTSGPHPNDFLAFLELRELGRSLITPIPGRSTHCEPHWASPLVDWSLV